MILAACRLISMFIQVSSLLRSVLLASMQSSTRGMSQHDLKSNRPFLLIRAMQSSAIAAVQRSKV